MTKIPEDELRELVQKRIDEAMLALGAEFEKRLAGGLGIISLNPVKNRNHWWELWKPRWRYEKLESNIELKVEPDSSLIRPTQPLPSKGRIIRSKSQAEYTPGAKNKGGRVVRQIPKQLKKIRDAQNVSQV